MDGTRTLTFVIFIFMCLCKYVCSDLPLYATKTGYDLSTETFGSLSNRELNWLDLARATGADVPEGLNSCTPDGIYAVYRHGTRNPSDGDLEDMHSIIDRLQNTEINPEFYLLRDFPKIPIANASQLVEAGWEELRTLAERLITRFPELFPDTDFDLTQFSFQSTNKSRTVDSAQGFIEGLVGKNQTCQSNYSEKYFTVECSENDGTVTPTSAVIPHLPLDNDTLLRFYDVWETCSEAVNNGKTDSEQNAFRDGPEIGEVWQRVAKKLAAPGSQPWNISRGECSYCVSVIVKMGSRSWVSPIRPFWCQQILWTPSESLAPAPDIQKFRDFFTFVLDPNHKTRLSGPSRKHCHKLQYCRIIHLLKLSNKSWVHFCTLVNGVQSIGLSSSKWGGR